MLTSLAKRESRTSFWLRVREFAVPPSMIELATDRRRAGDWAGACAAARIDVDLNLRAVARAYGGGLAARVRADLRHLAPDLLRWHMPRIAPDGLLRPGLTLALARYAPDGHQGSGRAGPGAVHLVARTAPAWADAGQRISLALWDGAGSGPGAGVCHHPHAHPSRRFRLDLHRHLWDVRRADELRVRSGADRVTAASRPAPEPALDLGLGLDPELRAAVPQGLGCAVDRWAAEAGILLRAEGRDAGPVAVRLGARQRLILEVEAGVDGAGASSSPSGVRITAVSAKRHSTAVPVLPDAATWVLPDLELLRSGAIQADRLHPLVASALAPDHPPGAPSRMPKRRTTDGPRGAAGPHIVECRGTRHRIGLVDGVLAPLDHDPAEIRREELLAALSGTPLPCLRVIDEVHRHPDCLPGIRERLDHGDTAGALAVVESLLGPAALLRDGALRDELEAAAERRITHGLYRAGLIGAGRRAPVRGDPRRYDRHRSRSRHARAA